MKAISKELFIIVLLLMIVVFTIGIIFYKYMPNNKTVPEAVTYTPDSSTTEVLSEISEATAYSGSEEEKVQEVIKSYSIGPKELSAAASKKTYVSGKTDPFAEYKDPSAAAQNTNTAGNNNTTGAQTTNTTTPSTTAPSASSNSSSTGTFFESKSSK